MSGIDEKKRERKKGESKSSGSECRARIYLAPIDILIGC